MQSGLATIIALSGALGVNVLPDDKEIQKMSRKIKSGGWKPIGKHIDKGYAFNGESITRISSKVGRNEPCPCGSGKKYKNCHLKLDENRDNK